MQQKALIRIPLQLTWSVLLTAFTVVLGAAPLKALRNAMRPAAYWACIFAAVALLAGFGMGILAAALGIQAVVIGLYAEFEEHGFSVAQSALVALTTTTLFGVAGFYLWLAYKGKGVLTSLAADIDALIAKVASPESQAVFAGMKGDQILSLAPSLLIIALVLSLAFALIFERPLTHWMGAIVRRKEKLSMFSVPEFFIWPFIAALLLAFAKTDLSYTQTIGQNALNVLGTLYFLQGLAVLIRSFEIFKVGFFGRFVLIFILAVQLPIVLAVIGVVDYWVDFRKVFQKKIAQAKKRLQE